MFGALLLTWPAIYNRYPLLYPDSMTYIADGLPVARALFLHQLSNYYGMRSLIYSLVIFPFHWNVTPWPVVCLQSLLASWILWLVVRSVLERPGVVRFLLIVSLLSLASSVSWYASLVMPDILGPLLYLAIYLLVFAREKLSGRERCALAVIAGWAATSHITHLAVAAGICLLLTALWLLRWPPMKPRVRALGEIALIVLLAAAGQLALHGYLYGKPSLNGDAPPFLAARIVADGPGRWYLERHCNETHFALCDYVDDLPDSADEFLWNPEGISAHAGRKGDDRIRQQEMAFVLAVLHAYPREQLAISAANVWQQLGAFGLWDLDRNNWVLEAIDTALPGAKASYLGSWQFNDDLPLDFFSEFQFWVVIASLGIIGMAAVSGFMMRDPSSRLFGLGTIVLPAVIANAFLTGVFSNVDERYQCRVVWLIPLLAGLLVARYATGGSPASAASSPSSGLKAIP